VGIVFQDPEKQLVMTTVEAELAFGLENLGLPPKEMFPRVAGVMSFLYLTPLKDKFTGNLSGGEKQKVALAAVLAMQPRVLILDEPTSQLDPVAAGKFFDLIERLNREMGHTVILIEQRLERCFHLADRLALMEQGEIRRVGPPDEVARWEVKQSFPFIPPVAKFFASLDTPFIPLTVKDGRKELKSLFSRPPASGNDRIGPSCAPAVMTWKTQPYRQPCREKVEVQDVWFTYRNGTEALKGVNLRIAEGEFVAVLGENAAGKSTLLKLMVGLLKPGRGRVALLGTDTRSVSPAAFARRIGYLSQNPNDYLFQDTVEGELRFTLSNLGLEDNGAIDTLLEKLELTTHRDANPRDLSSGERQRAALASVLAAQPEFVVLDEPTRGIDCRLKEMLGEFLRALSKEGVGVVVATHDVEFTAEYAGRVITMFDGRIVSNGPRAEILSNSLFYAPQMARLFRGFADDVLTVREGMARISLNGDSRYASRKK
jgi:energy-coupling factor transport system ATP-binding protein